MACLTAYVIYFCTETHYEKCLKKVSRFVHEQNEQVWTKRGLLLTDPVERGLRVIEIAILTEPVQVGSDLQVKWVNVNVTSVVPQQAPIICSLGMKILTKLHEKFISG